MSNVLVMYHARCTDGFCSAWIAKKVFKDAQFHAAHFGEEPPDVTDKEVFILDFSYKRSTMLALKSKAKSLTLLDHHITAANDLKGLPFCIFDMEKSGAGLTWHYFSHWTYPHLVPFFNEPAPWLVEYVQDRDLGKNELPKSKEVSSVIFSYPFEFCLWDKLAAKSLEEVQREGEPILRYQEQASNDLVTYAREVELDGYKVLAVNTSIMNTDVGCKLIKDRPFGIVWFQREDGKYAYSLRSHGKVDVSKIALNHGGGGHAGAAGFISDKLIF